MERALGKDKEVSEHSSLQAKRQMARNILENTTRTQFERHPERFLSLTSATEKAGFYVSPADIAHFSNVLDEEGIPYGSYSRLKNGRPYKSYFVLPEQVLDITLTLRGRRDLDKFRTPRSYKQIGGKPVELPRSNVFTRRRGGYVGIKEKLIKLGMDWNKVLENSPVPIFKRKRHQYVVMVKDYERLMEWAVENVKRIRS